MTSGGPSVNKLKPGDQILQINGEDVKLAPRDHVIQLVRKCRETVSLVVCQPPLDNVRLLCFRYYYNTDREFKAKYRNIIEYLLHTLCYLYVIGQSYI